MAACGILDWRCLPHLAYCDYVAYVRRQARESSLPAWRAGVIRYGVQVPYNQLRGSSSSVLVRVQKMSLPWELLIAIRGWCRIRAGLVCLRAVHGRRSRARLQGCIFCARCVWNATNHAVARCAHWSDLREAFLKIRPEMRVLPTGSLCLAIMGCEPPAAGFCESVILSDAIDRSALKFWSSSPL
jgi:hypothetical protein